MAHLDAAPIVERAVRSSTQVSPARAEGDVGDDVRLPVAAVVDVADVEAGLVGAGDEVGVASTAVSATTCTPLGDAHRRGVAGDEAGLRASSSVIGAQVESPSSAFRA